MSPAQRSGAACAARYASGSRKQKRLSATAVSAKPPSSWYPVKRARSQRFSSHCGRIGTRRTPIRARGRRRARRAPASRLPGRSLRRCRQSGGRGRAAASDRKLPVQHVEIRPADAAGLYADTHLSGRGLRNRGSSRTSCPAVSAPSRHYRQPNSRADVVYAALVRSPERRDLRARLAVPRLKRLWLEVPETRPRREAGLEEPR